MVVKNYKKSVKKSKIKRSPVKRLRFGALDVPRGMRPVSSYKEYARTRGGPFLTMPFGPPQPWLVPPTPPKRISKFGNSLAGKRVTPSGYLSNWNSQPIVGPPRWNPLLLQGGNTFVQGINSPTLMDVVASFGRRKKAIKKRKVTKVVTKKRKVVTKKRKVVTKKRKVTKNKAKKLGINLTVKQNGKRVYKTKNVLEKQIKNK
jgi:hypothetical protein